MLPGGLAGLRLTVHPPPAADDPLDMVSGAGAAHREQPLLGLGRGHARQGPNLRVGAFAAGWSACSSAVSSPSWSRERVSITSPPCSGATLPRSFGPAFFFNDTATTE